MLPNQMHLSVAQLFKKSAISVAVSAALAGAPALAGDTFLNSDQPPLQLAQSDAWYNAFYQDYSDCDAQLLAAFWNTDYQSAKIQAGNKVLNGESGALWELSVLPALDQSSPQNGLPDEEIFGCYYDQNVGNSQFALSDLETIACIWQQQTGGQISEAQSKLVYGWFTAFRDQQLIDGAMTDAINNGCPGARG